MTTLAGLRVDKEFLKKQVAFSTLALAFVLFAGALDDIHDVPHGLLFITVLPMLVACREENILASLKTRKCKH